MRSWYNFFLQNIRNLSVCIIPPSIKALIGQSKKIISSSPYLPDRMHFLYFLRVVCRILLSIFTYLSKLIDLPFFSQNYSISLANFYINCIFSINWSKILVNFLSNSSNYPSSASTYISSWTIPYLYFINFSCRFQSYLCKLGTGAITASTKSKFLSVTTTKHPAFTGQYNRMQWTTSYFDNHFIICQ